MPNIYRLAKLTSRNQLCLPKAAVEEMGNPTHFRVVTASDALVLYPAGVQAAVELETAMERLGYSTEQVAQVQRELARMRRRR